MREYNNSDLKEKELSLRKKGPYSWVFWSVFSEIRTEYGEILRMAECWKIWTRKSPNTGTFYAV